MKENGCQLSLQVIPREIKDTIKGKIWFIFNQALSASPKWFSQGLQIMYLWSYVSGCKNYTFRDMYVFVKNKLSMKTVSLAERIEIHTKNTSLVFLCLEQINNKTCKYIALQEFYKVQLQQMRITFRLLVLFGWHFLQFNYSVIWGRHFA